MPDSWRREVIHAGGAHFGSLAVQPARSAHSGMVASSQGMVGKGILRKKFYYGIWMWPLRLPGRGHGRRSIDPPIEWEVVHMGLVGDAADTSHAREQFLEGGLVEGGVRGFILSSWQRCRRLGLSRIRPNCPFVRTSIWTVDSFTQRSRCSTGCRPPRIRRPTDECGSGRRGRGSAAAPLRREVSGNSACSDSEAFQVLCSPNGLPGPTVSVSRSQKGGSATSTGLSISQSDHNRMPARRSPYVTCSADVSRASSLSDVSAARRLRPWTPIYAVPPMPLNGACWTRVRYGSAACCARISMPGSGCRGARPRSATACRSN